MSDLIIGVVVDILIHVFIECREGLGVVWITGATRNLGILDSAKFIVLNPKVGLE